MEGRLLLCVSGVDPESECAVVGAVASGVGACWGGVVGVGVGWREGGWGGVGVRGVALVKLVEFRSGASSCADCG